MRHVTMLHRECSERPALGDAMVLAKAWLCASEGARGARREGVSGFLVSMLLLYVARSDASSVERSALELFRGALQLLGEKGGWCASRPLTLPAGSDREESADCFGGSDATGAAWTASAFARTHELVLLDAPARVNLAARVSLAALEELRADARVALRLSRADAVAGSLGAIFQRHSTARQQACYDCVVRVPLLPLDSVSSNKDASGRAAAWEAARSTATSAKEHEDALGEPLAEAVARRVAAAVRQALATRTTSVRVLGACDDESQLTPSSEEEAERRYVGVGVALRPDEEAVKVALRGPRSDDAAGALQRPNSTSQGLSRVFPQCLTGRHISRE